MIKLLENNYIYKHKLKMGYFIKILISCNNRSNQSSKKLSTTKTIINKWKVNYHSYQNKLKIRIKL